MEGVRGRERGSRARHQGQELNLSSACLTRKLPSILKGEEEGGMTYDFKNISLATTICSAKLPLQTSMILVLRESPRRGIEVKSTGHNVLRLLLHTNKLLSRKKVAPVSTAPSVQATSPPPLPHYDTHTRMRSSLSTP